MDSALPETPTQAPGASPAPGATHTLYSQHEHTHPEGTPFHLHTEDERVPATYDDVFELLTDISERLKRVEAFCNDVQSAVNSMPAFPFMPKFPKVGVSNGGR